MKKQQNKFIDNEQLLTVEQVASYLQLQKSTIYVYAQRGKIPAFKVGRNWRFKRGDLDVWLENNRRGYGAA
jgi:excisionase family DNA binding protein